MYERWSVFGQFSFLKCFLICLLARAGYIKHACWSGGQGGKGAGTTSVQPEAECL